MSKEDLRLLLKKKETDAEFAEKFEECKDVAERMALVKKAGFDLTEAELKEADHKLNDSSLDDVSGGLRNYPTEETTEISDDTKNKI